MTRRQWSLVVLMILINYLVFSQLFQRVINTDPSVAAVTRTPEATYTTTPTLDVPIIDLPTSQPTTEFGTPTATNTRVLYSGEQAKAATATVGAVQTQQALVAEQTRNAQQADPAQGDSPPTDTPTPVPANTAPSVTASNGPVNLRTGPGTNYNRSGVLPAGQSLEIVGRNANASWWQVSTVSGLRWIAASVTTAQNTSSSIPVVQAPPPPTSPPPPPATNTPVSAPPPPPQPAQQYTIRNIFGQVNEAITQVRGDIRDAGGNAVNGVRVRVRSGSFCTVSYPSGPPGGYPNGVYDILLDNRAKPGNWNVSIVDGPADPKQTACEGNLRILSEEVSVPTNNLEGVVFVEWQKNF